MNCENIQKKLHQRTDLYGEPLREFSDHVSACVDCRRMMVEVERLDEMLSSWLAPNPAPGFSERVLTALTESGAMVSCDIVAEEIHHYVSKALRAVEDHTN